MNETNGSWGDAQEVSGVGNDPVIDSVSCGSAGNCAAGGYYLASEDNWQAYVVNETDGVWGETEEVPGIATLDTGQNASIYSLSCASAGNCAAGGYYVDSSNNNQVFVVSETNGTWGNAEEVPGIETLNTGDASINSVSCASAGNCAAAGDYEDLSGDNRSTPSL